jgi:MIP family channel proteins
MASPTSYRSTIVEIPTPETDFTTTPPDVRPLWKDITLEFFGTLTFVYIAIAGVNQVILSSPGNIDQFHIALCFALGLSSGIIIAGKSGGHLNPAVSFTVYASSNDFELVRLLGYIAAQLCGGFVAGLLVLSVYGSWINDYEESDLLIGAFGTLRNPHNTMVCAVVDQFIGSALLMFGILVTPSSWLKPITVGAILGGIGLFQGSNGFAINLARDLGPRLASTIMFGSDAFTDMDQWYLIPVLVPFIGMPFAWVLSLLFKKLQ